MTGDIGAGMGDTDRFREAADLIDSWLERQALDIGLEAMVVAATPIPRERAATAALLRAMADLVGDWDKPGPWFALSASPRHPEVAVWDAALALIDILLGDDR